MDKIFCVELTGNHRFYNLSLPATDHELLDALDRLGMTGQDKPQCKITEHTHFQYLELYLVNECSIYELNALSYRLSCMNHRQEAAFEGLFRTALNQRKGPMSVADLFTYANSTECCHVLSGVMDDAGLGRFYAENGFVPEVENISDTVFELLDFDKIGKSARMSEQGLFTNLGYVVQNADLNLDTLTHDDPPQKPDYEILLRLSNGPHTTQLKLPATSSEMDHALDEIGMGSWEELELCCVDCAVPNLKEAINEAVSLAHVNRLAGRLSRLDHGSMVKYKAIITAVDVEDVIEASLLADHLTEYSVETTLYDPCSIAKAELRTICFGRTSEALLPHVNLYAYGEALLQNENFALTDYGLVVRLNGEPIQSPTEPSRWCGMEMK